MPPPANLRPFDEANLRVAFDEALRASKEDGCMPFGSCLADPDTGEVVTKGRNACKAGGTRGGSKKATDVTRHAEMELVRSATLDVDPEIRSKMTLCTSCKLRWMMSVFRTDLRLYAFYEPTNVRCSRDCFFFFCADTSTEPCVMCAGAIYWSGVDRIVYGCSALQLENLLDGPPMGFDIDARSLYGQGRSRRCQEMQVVGPLLDEEALAVHRNAGVWNLCKGKDIGSGKNQADQDIAMELSLKNSGLGSAGVVEDGVVPV